MVEIAVKKVLTLPERFQQYFSVDLASTPEQKKKVYQIRYRVYCDEFCYEPAHRFPDKQEYDDYDEYALHCLITHRSSGITAGCVRLVPAGGSLEQAPLPFEKFCRNSLDRKFIEDLNLDRNAVCEISRLAVDAAFRRRSGEAATRYGEANALCCERMEQRTFPIISVAGFLAATALTELTGRTNVFAMMEPFLPRLLKRSGILFQRAGRDTNYHGIRAPYFIRTQSALDNLCLDLLGLYESIHGQIKKRYSSLC